VPAFAKGNVAQTPFGKNNYLRSTRNTTFESYTVAAASVPARTIDGKTGQKILKAGTVMAKITSGADAGKIGPFQAGVADGRQTLANVVGINDTFLPWQLIERDVEAAVLRTGTAVQGWCIELDAGGLEIVLTDDTAAAMQNQKSIDIQFV
jgi:hypothetical protein